MQTISLIIPCYRDAATLARAIDSVQIQTQNVDEIIVVNDCSPETAAIELVLQAYPDVVYIKNTTNLGLAETRNKGVDVAHSEIITFLDADDELHPQKIELQSKVLMDNCAVTTEVRRVYNEGRAISLPHYDHYPAFNEVRETTRILLGNHLTGASLMIHKEIFTREGGYDSKLRSCEDFDLWLRLLDSGISVRKVKLPLYLYYFNSEGLSQNYSDISYWELEVLKKYFSFSRMDNNGQRRIVKYIFFVWLIKHFIRIQKSSDNGLAEVTNKNVGVLLATSPFLRLSIGFLAKSQLLRLYVFLDDICRRLKLYD